ncbi:hypothetical protein ACE6H2_001242 [Prunus campanulata]
MEAKKKKKTSVVIEELNEDPNGEQSGGGTQKPRESSAGQGVYEKGKEKAAERESSAVQKDKERAVERESPATVDKGKSKVSSIFGKGRARAFGKRRCKNVKKTHDKEDQRSNTVTEGPVQKEVVEGNQTTQTSEVGPSTKSRRAKLARSVQKGKWKRKATNAAGSSNAPPTDSAAPSLTPATGFAFLATGSAPPASTEASTGNSYLSRK